MVGTLVLFDIDGTLVDSNDAHAEAWRLALAEHGTTIAVNQIRAAIGKGGDKLLPDVAGIDPESAAGKAIRESRGRFFKERFLPVLKAFPCAREVMLRMKQTGFNVGVASSANEDEVRALLSIARVDDLVEGASSADDVERSKPDPDVVYADLRDLLAHWDSGPFCSSVAFVQH